MKLVLDKSDFEIVIWNEKGNSLKSQIKNENWWEQCIKCSMLAKAGNAIYARPLAAIDAIE